MFTCFVCFFFFKQKTAYDVRISDWSSDVCSSDLVRRYHWTLDFNWKLYLDSSVEGCHAAFVHLFNNTGQVASNNPAPLWIPNDWLRLIKDHRVVGIQQNVGEGDLAPMEALPFRHGSAARPDAHTHELQSLM